VGRARATRVDRSAASHRARLPASPGRRIFAIAAKNRSRFAAAPPASCHMDREASAPDATGPNVTRLLRAHAVGDPDALGQLRPRVYDELRRIASARLRRERADHTRSASEVVHEEFLDRLPSGRLHWLSRAHFFAIASRGASANGVKDGGDGRIMPECGLGLVRMARLRCGTMGSAGTIAEIVASRRRERERQQPPAARHEKPVRGVIPGGDRSRAASASQRWCSAAWRRWCGRCARGIAPYC